MLYVFQVDTGQMLTFDMNLALDSASTLQNTIEAQHGIAVGKQVLLISGGECLTPSTRICNYPCGTDTNPIFLFNKANIESGPNSIETNIPSEEFIIEESPPSYATLVARSNLAEKLLENGRAVLQRSEMLIHDQHLQHLGWGAVRANLEDMCTIFSRRVESFSRDISSPVEDVDEKELGASISTLEKVIIPSYLVTEEEETETTNKDALATATIEESCIATKEGEDDEDEDEEKSEEVEEGERKTLLAYLTLRNPTPLTSLPASYAQCRQNHCSQSTQQLLVDSNQILQKTQSNQMLVIKGLSERLFTLDQLLGTSKKIIKEQSELTASLFTTTQRAKDETSILADLCSSHKQQLQVMINNHEKLVDISRRCLRAKEELILNLLTRLKWVMFVQKSISESNARISVSIANLKKLRALTHVAQQVISTESTFHSCLKELSRRQSWEATYNEEIGKIQKKFFPVFQAEVDKRGEFQNVHSHHFLFSTLFSSLECVPSNVFDEIQSVPAPSGDSVQIDYDLFEKTDSEKEIQSIRREYDGKIEALKRDYEGRIQELMTKGREEMEALVAKGKSEMDAVKSRVKLLSRATKSESLDDKLSALAKRLNINHPTSCKIGDVVMTYFSEKYESFVIWSDSSVHFLHGGNEKEMQESCIYSGCVVDKEYCVAKKAQNRYNVPMGFHFYRVTLRIIDRFNF